MWVPTSSLLLSRSWISSAYNFLLGRPWIHAVDAVTFVLHQKLKFLFEDKLLIVCGEEDFIISELSSFRYVETEEGIAEVPFQGLDFEKISSASVNQSQSTTIVLSSTKSAKKTLENDYLPVWGQIVKVFEKHDRFGLVYHHISRHPAAMRGKKFNPIRFITHAISLILP